MEKKLFEDKFVIGLTGGIASGKSTVAAMLSGQYFTEIDADKISRDLLKNDPQLISEIADAFPNVAFKGVVDRTELRNAVFGDNDALDLLNSLTHPRIIKSIFKQIENAPHSVVILIAPLLFETRLEKYCDCVLSIVCNEETRIKRLMLRDGISADLAQKMIAAQTTDLYKTQHSDYIIDTNTELACIKRGILKLYWLWRLLSHQKHFNADMERRREKYI